MSEKRPINRLALSNLPTNVPLKRIKKDNKKTNFVNETLKNISKSQKSSLILKLNERQKSDDDSNPLDEQLHMEGYEKDHIRFLLGDEKRYVLTRSFLESSIHSIYSRCYILNILLKMQKYYALQNAEYYLAVKLMDYSLSVCKEPKDGVVHAVTCFWMVHKFSNSNVFISTSNILEFLRVTLSGEFNSTKGDILKMEKKILAASDFKIEFPEPSIFIEHFFRKLKLGHNKLVYHGTYFVCDCLSMFPKFSYEQTSLIAVMALYTTLIVMNKDTSRMFKLIQNVFHEGLIKDTFAATILKISNIKKSLLLEVFTKYSTAERLGVSMLFERYVLAQQAN